VKAKPFNYKHPEDTYTDEGHVTKLNRNAFSSNSISNIVAQPSESANIFTNSNAHNGALRKTRPKSERRSQVRAQPSQISQKQPRYIAMQ
jgi:hypothetical protein